MNRGLHSSITLLVEIVTSDKSKDGIDGSSSIFYQKLAKYIMASSKPVFV